MAKQTKHTIRLPDADPDKVLEVLSSADFEIAQNTAQEGNKSATVEEISRDDKSFVYEIHTVEYGKGITGIDRSKTVTSRTRVKWDLAKRQSEWTYHGEHDKRAKVWGGTRIEPQGDGCVAHMEFGVDIKVPLVGGKIEKIIIKESDKHWPTFERLLRDRL